METSVIRCSYCSQVNDYTDSKGGCPSCGAPLPDLSTEELLPAIDLGCSWSIMRVAPNLPIRSYDRHLALPAHSVHCYDVPRSGILLAVTFHHSKLTKIRELRYIVEADHAHELLNVRNIAYITKAPVGIDARYLQRLRIVIHNDGDNPAHVTITLQFQE